MNDCPKCGMIGGASMTHLCESTFEGYHQVIRDLTPAEICQYYTKIIAEKDALLESARLDKNILEAKLAVEKDEVGKLQVRLGIYHDALCEKCSEKVEHILGLDGKKEDV